MIWLPLHDMLLLLCYVPSCGIHVLHRWHNQGKHSIWSLHHMHGPFIMTENNPPSSDVSTTQA